MLPAAGASANGPSAAEASAQLPTPAAEVSPPADGHASAGDPAAARYAATVRLAQEKEATKERKAAERQAERDQQKREKEAAKDLPETKAAKWMLGIAKDIVNCKEAIAETKDSKILISKVKKKRYAEAL